MNINENTTEKNSLYKLEVKKPHENIKEKENLSQNINSEERKNNSEFNEQNIFQDQKEENQNENKKYTYNDNEEAKRDEINRGKRDYNEKENINTDIQYNNIKNIEINEGENELNNFNGNDENYEDNNYINKLRKEYKNINNIKTNKTEKEKKNIIITTSKTQTEIIKNEGVEDDTEDNKENDINNNIYNTSIKENQEITIDNKENDINIINQKEFNKNGNESYKEELANKDNQNKWMINPEESITFKQDSSLGNKIRISNLLKRENPISLFEIMDEPSMVDIDIDFPVIPKIIFTEEELEGENEKNLNDLLKLPEFMLGDIGHPLERKKIKNDKKSYSSQKIKENKKFSMKKDKMPNLKGKSINLQNLNLKSLNIYPSTNKNNKQNKFKNVVKSTSEDFNDNINLISKYNSYRANKANIHANNLKLLSNSKSKKSSVFIKKRPENQNQKKYYIEDKIKNH